MFTIGGRAVSIFLIIGSTKFLTSYLSEAAYGQLALYNITAILPSTLFFAPLGQGITRFYPVAKEQQDIQAFHYQYQHIFNAGAKIVLVIGFIAACLCWFAGLRDWSISCILTAGLGIVSSLNTYRYGLQNSMRKRHLALSLEITERVFQQGLAILFLWLISSNPLMVIFAYFIASSVFYAINQHYYLKTFPEIRNKPPEAASNQYSVELLRYSWPFVLFGVFYWAQNASERWILDFMRSSEKVGQYAVLNQIGFQSLTLLYGSISYFLFPILLNRAGTTRQNRQFEDANNLNNWYLWFNILLTLTLAAVFYVWGPLIIRVLSAEKYVKLAGYLPAMVLAGGLFNFGQAYSNRFMLAFQTKKLLVPKITVSVSAVLLNFAGVYWYGLPGLVAAILCTQVIYLFALVVVWNSLRYRMTHLQ